MKYYAVRNGRTTGILTSWDECKKSVTGYSGAEFKSFTSLEDAKAYIRNEASKTEEIPTDGVIAYVDGSYNIKTKVFACGVVILNNGEEITLSEAYNDKELSQMRNVAGEINGSMLAMKYCIENGIDNLHIFYDYEGIEKWCTSSWKTNKEGTAAYKAFYDSIKDKIKITFHKVKGHSGDKYNDMADSLAKAAAGVE